MTPDERRDLAAGFLFAAPLGVAVILAVAVWTDAADLVCPMLAWGGAGGVLVGAVAALWEGR